tara:strand:+ start:418 stop:801 length:384 start_codon:yes stop_codon:yes gene_type:complete
MKNFTDLYEGLKKVDVVQRKKQARRMSKMAKSATFQMKKKKAALRMRNPAKLQTVARKQVIKSFRNKFYPNYDQMSLQQRVVVDQKLNQKYGKKMDKMTKKAVMKLKKVEVERVKKARAAAQGKTDA